MLNTFDFAPREGGASPWGKIDHVTILGAPGIWFVSTPTYGGIKLQHARNSVVPSYMRREGGWYEEDCDWAIAALVHRRSINDTTLCAAVDNGDAKRSLCHYEPEAFERWFGEIVYPGMSHARDEEIFRRNHAQDWVVIVAVGDWHTNVPAGYCGVVCTLGAQRSYLYPCKYFLVPDAEYQAAGGHFVVDPTRHQETAPF